MSILPSAMMLANADCMTEPRVRRLLSCPAYAFSCCSSWGVSLDCNSAYTLLISAPISDGLSRMTCSFVRRAGTFKIMANITSCTMPTRGTGVVAVVVVVVVVVVVGVGVGVGVALIGVALIGVALIGVAVFNGSDAAISSGVGFGSVVGAMVWMLCGTEMPMTALAIKWVLFVAA